MEAMEEPKEKQALKIKMNQHNGHTTWAYAILSFCKYCILPQQNVFSPLSCSKHCG
jgi:hypothetical protein